MPIYEYHCTKCNRDFEELVFGDALPNCPHCQTAQVEKVLSKPCLHTKPCSDFSSSPPSSGSTGCGGCTGGNCASCH